MEFDGVADLCYLLNEHMHMNNRLCVYTVCYALLRDTGTVPPVIYLYIIYFVTFYFVFTDILALN